MQWLKIAILGVSLSSVVGSNLNKTRSANKWLLKYDGRTYNHAGSVHQLVIHPYNAKQPLLQHLHDAIPPLDGQTLPESQQEITI